MITTKINTREFELTDTSWDDMLGPAIARNIDVSSGRIAFNYYNGAISFANNARYPEEPLTLRYQIPHKWKVGTNGKLHVHWKQQHATNYPNWYIGYKVSGSGDADIIETDWSNYTFAVRQSNAFAYTSGVLNQISFFASIDLSTANISDSITVVLFRDTANTSTVFAGADPSALTEYVTDVDIHIEIDTLGSDEEYTK